MAPALTKILKDGHGIHLSSPPASVKIDSDGSAMRSTDLDVQLISTDEGDLQKMWLNLSMIPSLNSFLPMSPLDVPANPVLTPCLQTLPSQGESLLFHSPAHLFSLLSSNKGLRDSQQVASAFPGVPDMFLVPVPEDNSQEASLLQGCSAVPDGGDVHHFPLSFLHSYSHGGKKHQDYTPALTPLPSLTQEREAGIGCLIPSEQPFRVRVSSDQPAPRAVPGEAVKEQLCRQAGLCSRAKRLQTRLQALLVEHTLSHCDQQLEGLKSHCQLEHESFESLNSIHSGILPPQLDFSPQFSWQESSTATLSFEELREFSFCSQAVLRGLQEALDSEATASSSSDEEETEDKQHSKRRTSPVSSSSRGSSERLWLEERAELGSRWSWLQVRLTELEGRIQQLMGLHKHIRSTKGGVVLAQSQPMTDRQIQHTLLREMVGLSGSASDVDTEHCSPTRLLHNIERQSAQLSQIVNSLMTPLSFSPLSKQPHSWRGKGSFTSGQKGGDVLMPGSFKTRRPGIRRLFKADLSYVCARTRPLVTYHKPRLFSFKSRSPRSPQDSGTSTSSLSSSLSSSSCSHCSSCDPIVSCFDPGCSSSRVQQTRTSSSTHHPVSSSSFDTPLSRPTKEAQNREEWFLRPLVITAQASSPTLCKRRSSTPLNNSHKNKHHGRHHKSRVIGLSPIRMAGSAASQHRRANQRKRKRRHIQRLIEDEDVLYQLYDPEDSSDDIQEDGCTQVSHKQVSRGCVRKRQGESVYNINNIVIPMSVAKVEKLQYKDILTPSWRMLDSSSQINREEEKETKIEEGEDLTDEAFVQRHVTSEQREKMRWSSWGKRKCCRQSNRSGSRLSSSGGGMCTSGEESSVELSCAQLDTDEQQSLEEWLQPQTPWKPRTFPLGDDEEEALLPDNLEKAPPGWPECCSVSYTSKNSMCQLSPALSSGATLPSRGKSKASTDNGS
ncbi:KAT8 regulatory NSL complex subunit 1-like protein isoform X3 [Notolabrus celidotus]|uniref:KAT8 regulatory NSL complex subunit 1-like protein isoform X3 n=1 Tax=Notolabrus celidotus TaxID=1203425 RepID=UPI00148F4B7F|nr:KAT8 regulatory NSL complex subunit 1-like protein isoform X3 [Notolabrus celidotus]